MCDAWSRFNLQSARENIFCLFFYFMTRVTLRSLTQHDYSPGWCPPDLHKCIKQICGRLGASRRMLWHDLAHVSILLTLADSTVCLPRIWSSNRMYPKGLIITLDCNDNELPLIWFCPIWQDHPQCSFILFFFWEPNVVMIWSRIDWSYFGAVFFNGRSKIEIPTVSHFNKNPEMKTLNRLLYVPTSETYCPG